MRLYRLLGKYVAVCKAYGKQGGLGTCSPGNFDFGPFIRRNLGLFSHKHNLPFIVSLKLL